MKYLGVSEGLFVFCLLTQIFQDDPWRFHNTVKGVFIYTEIVGKYSKHY